MKKGVNMFKIEKDIPIPPVNRKVRRKPNSITKCLQELEVNESFVVPIPDGSNPMAFRNQIGYAKSIIKQKRKDNFSITTREVDEGIRVWRVE